MILTSVLLPAAVGPEQPEDLAPPHVHLDPLQGVDLSPVDLGDVAEVDREVGGFAHGWRHCGAHGRFCNRGVNACRVRRPRRVGLELHLKPQPDVRLVADVGDFVALSRRTRC